MRTWIDPVDAQALTEAVARALAGGAVLVVEGDFGADAFQEVRHLAVEIPEGVVRESPESPDVLAFPLELRTVDQVVDALRRDPPVIVHIKALQIQKRGVPEFVAGDAFHHECVWVGPGVPQSLLQGLVRDGVIRSELRLRRSGDNGG